MTRFQIVGIFDDTILTSIEFNGDGYFDGYGYIVCKHFLQATTKDEYKGIVETFNKDIFGYNVIDIVGEMEKEDFNFEEMGKGSLYYDIWFSDYLYIKNFSSEEFTFKDRNGAEITIHPDGYVTLYFGKFIDQEEEDEKTLKTIKSYYKTTIDKIPRYRKICEDLGWTLRVYPDSNLAELEKYSRAGEDFAFSVSIDNFIKDVCDYANDFDVDEHVRMWVQAGDCGQPMSVRALLEDAENIDEMLSDLANALEKLNK